MFKILLTGNLTKTAEWKSGNQGDFLSFDVAINLTKDKVQFVSCTINSGAYADKIAPYLTKGQKVLIDGTPKADAYIDKQGKAVSALRVYVNNVELLGDKPQG